MDQRGGLLISGVDLDARLAYEESDGADSDVDGVQPARLATASWVTDGACATLDRHLQRTTSVSPSVNPTAPTADVMVVAVLIQCAIAER